MCLLAVSFIFSCLLSVSAARGAAPGAGRFRAAVYEHEMVLSNAQLRAATLSNTGAALRLPRHPLLQGGRSQPHGGQPRGVGDTGVNINVVSTLSTLFTLSTLSTLSTPSNYNPPGGGGRQAGSSDHSAARGRDPRLRPGHQGDPQVRQRGAGEVADRGRR